MSLMSDDVQYESKSVKAIRGMEARTVAKWTADGWELASQTPGAISSELSFRRVKRKVSRAVGAAAAGMVVLVVVAITIGVIIERNEPTSAAPPVSATTEPGEAGGGTRAPTTQDSSTAAASPSEPAPSATLTATNNREFAKVLRAGYCDDRIDTFATKHEGKTVEFDGIILDLARHGNTKTRYDILIAPGTPSKPPKVRCFGTRTSTRPATSAGPTRSSSTRWGRGQSCSSPLRSATTTPTAASCRWPRSPPDPGDPKPSQRDHRRS